MMELLQRYLDRCGVYQGKLPEYIIIPNKHWANFENSWPYRVLSPSVVFDQYHFNGIPVRREQ